MSSFSVDSIETLDYDFTAAPSNSGKGMCKGKGTIPEPTQPLLEAYSEKVKALFGVDEDTDAKEAVEKMSDKDEAKERSEQLLAITAELCQNSPSKDELSELPPRIRNAFMKWVFRSLSDPEV